MVVLAAVRTVQMRRDDPAARGVREPWRGGRRRTLGEQLDVALPARSDPPVGRAVRLERRGPAHLERGRTLLHGSASQDDLDRRCVRTPVVDAHAVDGGIADPRELIALQRREAQPGPFGPDRPREHADAAADQPSDVARQHAGPPHLSGEPCDKSSASHDSARVGYQKDAAAATCRREVALVVALGSVSKALRSPAEPSPGVVRSGLDDGRCRPRVVLDVTSSIVWPGAPVGIVRTVRQFAAFLLDRNDVTAAFCRYDPSFRRYVEVDRALALCGPPASALEIRDPRAARRAGGVASAGRRIVDGLPAGMRADAALLARSTGLVLKSSYWLARGTWSAIRSRWRAAGHAASDSGDVELGATDVYVSMGVDWQHNDLRVLHDLKRTRGFRTVLYCHDLIPVTFPHLISADARPPSRAYFLDLARAADHVVAVSRTTAEELRRFMRDAGIDGPPISVVHPGSDFDGRAREAARAPRDELVRRPFVLCVGTIEMRKNHELLYNLWDRLVARHGDRVPPLVLVGMEGWGVDDLLTRMRANPRTADRIVLLGAVADPELVWLYEHCLFSVYPSFFEGWGLPVAESLALGTPCVTSNAPAVVEASGGVAPALDPLDFPAWLAEIERLAFEPPAREAAARRVRDYRATTWREHGEAMLGVVRAAAHEDGSGTDVRLALRPEF